MLISLKGTIYFYYMDNSVIKGSYLDVSGFHVSKDSLTKEQVQLIRSGLTVSPSGLGFAGDEKVTYKLFKYSKDKNEYRLPRYWAHDNIGEPEKLKFKHEKRPIKFKGTLRPYQQEIVDTCHKKMKEDGGGLISVGCGYGKTVMSLYIAHLLGLKTLVVVHKTFLQDQWIERIEQFTNAEVGIIRQDKVDIEDKDIVIASIQSIARRDYGKKIFKKFGFVIYDEAHHVSSKHFSRSLIQTGCKYTLALTATPYRLDGLIKVMYWFLGECIYKMKEKVVKSVVVKRFYYNSSDPELFVEKNMWRKLNTGGKVLPNTSKMITNLCKIDDRTDLQVDVIDHIIRMDSRRKILILSNRIEHLEELKLRYDIKLEDAVADGVIEEDEITTCYFYGKLSKEEREFSGNNGDIIFGTFEMAQEALDIPRLNTVLFFTPKKDIKQASGRILRKILRQGDTRPLIIDFVDDLSVFTKHAEHRAKYYRRKRFTIEDYYAFDNKFCTYRKYMKMKGFETSKKTKGGTADTKKIFRVAPITPDDLQEESESSDESSEDRGVDFSKSIFT